MPITNHAKLVSAMALGLAIKQAEDHQQKTKTKKSKVGPTHREFVEDSKTFQAACEAAEVKPTLRQASKYRRGMGKAYKGIK